MNTGLSILWAFYGRGGFGNKCLCNIWMQLNIIKSILHYVPRSFSDLITELLSSSPPWCDPALSLSLFSSLSREMELNSLAMVEIPSASPWSGLTLFLLKIRSWNTGGHHHQQHWPGRHDGGLSPYPFVIAMVRQLRGYWVGNCMGEICRDLDKK